METGCHSLHRLNRKAVITLIILCSLLFYIICMNFYFYSRTLEIIGVLRYLDQSIQQQALYRLFTGSINIIDGEYVLMKNGYQFSGKLNLFFDTYFVAISIGFFIIMFLVLYFIQNYNENRINEKNKELNYLKTEVEHFLFGAQIIRNDNYKECNYLLDRLQQRLFDMNQLNKSDFNRMINFHQNIIHQINTPLNTIKILIEYLYNQGEIDKNYLDNMNYAIRKASDLSHIYLRCSKMDTGKVVYHFEDIGLYELIEEVFISLKIYANYYHSVLVNKCDNSIINADSVWIKEAIENIVKNCIENSDTKIIISSFSNNNFSIIKIDTRGSTIGENIDNISFERFESSKSGIGIGLHLCKQIVEAHLGKINVEQNDKGELSFVIQLPRPLYKKKIKWGIEDEDNSRDEEY